MYGSMDGHQQEFALPWDVDEFVTWLEDYTRDPDYFKVPFKDATIIRTWAGANHKRTWELVYDHPDIDDAFYIYHGDYDPPSASAVRFNVTVLSNPNSREPQLWVQAQCRSDSRETLEFYTVLTEHLQSISKAWDAAELADGAQQQDVDNESAKRDQEIRRLRFEERMAYKAIMREIDKQATDKHWKSVGQERIEQICRSDPRYKSLSKRKEI